MARAFLTDEQVEIEIERMMNSDAIKLARKEKRLRMKRRIYMYDLRALEKRGNQLLKDGITFDNIEEKLFGEEGESDAD